MPTPAQDDDSPVARADLIDGLGKGLKIIEAFDADHARLTPSEAAERSGISRTAARRYLLTLRHYGYAASDGRRYWLTPRVLRLGQSYLEAARLPRLVQPFAQRLSQATGETVNLSVLDGHEVVFLVNSPPPRLISVGYPVGARLPAHGATAATVILASWSEAALAEWLAAHAFVSYTPQTVSRAEDFRAVVEATRQRGYGISENQFDPGLVGLAVGLRDRRGQCVAALGMTVPTPAQGLAGLTARLLPPLQDTAQLLRGIL
ncbi:MAG: hypothetical protein RLZZ584_2398 [Pseudomonadota bacterium]|jgi:IclR family pca regulon transcriptional regulator